MEILPLDRLASVIAVVDLRGSVAKLAECRLEDEGGGIDGDGCQGYDPRDFAPVIHHLSGYSRAPYAMLPPVVKSKVMT